MELTQKNQNQCCESYTDSGSASGGSITKLPFASSTLSLSGLSSTRNDPMDYHLSAVELSVLGACNCGISHAHPCRCAWTLVNSRREIAHLQNRVSTSFFQLLEKAWFWSNGHDAKNMLAEKIAKKKLKRVDHCDLQMLLPLVDSC